MVIMFHAIATNFSENFDRVCFGRIFRLFFQGFTCELA